MNIHIIYLAAGNSRRFGSQKLLYEYDGKSIYQYALDLLIDIVEQRNDCSLSIVYREKQIEEEYPDLDLIYSKKSKLGLSYSIEAGISNVNDNDYMMFVVADQIYLSKETIQDFINQFLLSNKKIGRVKYKNIYGSPTIFHPSFKQDLLSLKDDEGGKKIIKQHLDDCFEYEVSDILELYDIDTLDDLK